MPRLVEEFDAALLRCILSSGCIPRTNQRELLQLLEACPDGRHEVVYDVPHDGVGRYVARSKAGAMSTYTNMPREVRGTLASRLYHDVDMVNSQPSLCLQLFERRCGLEAPELRRYVEHREDALRQVVDACGHRVDRDRAKELFIRLLNKGSALTWCRDYSVDSDDLPAFVTRLQREVAANVRAVLARPEHAKYVAHQRSVKPDARDPAASAFA